IPFPISRDHVANAKAISAVVAKARATGARVVADSVESTAQEEALAVLGVEIVQGYLYGPEVVPGELRTLITRPGASLPRRSPRREADPSRTVSPRGARGPRYPRDRRRSRPHPLKGPVRPKRYRS